MTGDTTRDTAAQFEELYAQHFTPIVRLFRYWDQDWATAEDLTNELFEQLWRDVCAGAVALDQVERPGGFLKMRARWVFSRYLHKRHAERERPLDAGEVPFDQTDAGLRCALPAPDATVPTSLDLGRVLAMLPQQQRRAVALHYLEDQPVHHIAEQTGYTGPAVEQQISRALFTLRATEGLPTRTIRDMRASEARDRKDAIEAYRASVAAGKPLTMAALGKRFGRSVTWATTLLRTSGEQRPRANTETRVRETLRGQLTAGSWGPGEQLPTSTELAADFGLHKGNIGRILRTLAAEGLIEKRPVGATRREGYFARAAAPMAAVADLDAYRAARQARTANGPAPTIGTRAA
jgi:RNA polymerase sigma factor (sigma-70 family)